MIARLFRSRAPVIEENPPSIPEGIRVYAIGDIHGRLDLLTRLLEMIEQDSRDAGDLQTLLVYLGDYIDRGPASRQVVDRVMAPHAMVDRVVCLRGNHEDALLAFIEDAERGRVWLDYGGMAALLSYGVRVPTNMPANERFPFMAHELERLLPVEHGEFYRTLPLSETIGDYFFVHAGVNPRLPFAEQDAYDLTTIRSPFLEWGRKLEKIVVHGHSITDEPVFRPWRIGIDTGAFASGHLTCLVLEGTERRILAT